MIPWWLVEFILLELPGHAQTHQNGPAIITKGNENTFLGLAFCVYTHHPLEGLIFSIY